MRVRWAWAAEGTACSASLILPPCSPASRPRSPGGFPPVAARDERARCSGAARPRPRLRPSPVGAAAEHPKGWDSQGACAAAPPWPSAAPTRRKFIMLRIYPLVLEVLRELRSLIAQIERKDSDLTRQLRRCASSIARSAAEGMYSRGKNRQARYHSALGSAREALACLEVACALGYLPALDPTRAVICARGSFGSRRFAVRRRPSPPGPASAARPRISEANHLGFAQCSLRRHKTMTRRDVGGTRTARSR